MIVGVQGQVTAPPGNQTTANQVALPAPTPYTAVARDGNTRIWERTVYEYDTNGAVVPKKHHYTELATGMNYLSNGQWTPSKEEIDIQPDGTAAATQGQHQVYFPSDIYEGAIKIVTPDGKQLKSRPIGISYDDGSNTVFIATLTNSIGYLTASNQVTYRNCFSGINADLVCTYRRSGFECDLVFREQPPTPDQLGLNASLTTLQLVTEFFDTEDPQQVPAATNKSFSLQDETLKFGKMTMARGRAFSTALSNTNSHSASAYRLRTVYKNWAHLQGRTFLTEQIPLTNLADQLKALPLTSRTSRASDGKAQEIRMASNRKQFPPAHEILPNANHILVASANYNSRPGVVLDYNIIDSDQDGFTFESGETYLVEGQFNIYGATIQGGTVIKYDTETQFSGNPDPYTEGATINILGCLVCNTDPYHSATLTSISDNSAGEPIDNSSVPVGGLFLNVDSGWYCTEPCNLNIYYAGVGITIPVSRSDINIENCKFINCGVAILDNFDDGPGININLFNVLFGNCYNAFSLIPCDSSSTLNLYFVTADVNSFWDTSIYSDGCTFEPWVNDSILIGDMGDISGESCSIFDPSGLVFQSFMGNNYYLPPSNPYVDCNGVTGAQAGLYFYTTQTNQTIEGFSTVHLGYHYPAVTTSGQPVDTLVPGVPDYITDPSGDGQIEISPGGLPYWWEWYWFGSLTLNGTDLDGQGNTLLSDYQNGLDPNIINFSITMTNFYVKSTTVPLQLNVQGGIPSSMAVLIDDTNFAADASWQPYPGTNITEYLRRLSGGSHNMWIGLRGVATNATQTWQCQQIDLLLTPPLIVITGPANNTVDQPIIQLTGYSPGVLSSITYDISNANGLTTNQQILVLDQFYDTNAFAFTTNTFQGFDIPLTNGLNVITIHGTDLAGNVTTTNFNVTLDYTDKTNPPVVNLYWPQDQTLICNGNYTWRGWVNDPTATVAAQMADTSGDIYTFNATVGRDGNFWVENIPLSSGANYLTLSVTDVVGNVTVSNITVYSSALGLTITALSSDQLWSQGITVNGTISDSIDYTVWVNGAMATLNGDGTWTATNVYLPTGGVAVVQARAIPNSNNGGFGTGGSGGGPVTLDNLGNPDPAQDNDTEIQTDKPVRLYVKNYTENMTDNNYSGYDSWLNGNDSPWEHGTTVTYYEENWADAVGGSLFSHDQSQGQTSYGPSGPEICDYKNSWGPSSWPTLLYGTQIVTSPGADSCGPGTDGASEQPQIYWEHCVLDTSMATIYYQYVPPVGEVWAPGQYTDNFYNDNYHRNAQATIHLQTGGKGKIQRQNLFQLSGSASDMVRGLDILPQDIQIMGQSLNSSGYIYKVLPDSADEDVTPQVNGVDWYTFGVGEQKYLSQLNVFVCQPYPDYPNDAGWYGPYGPPLGYPIWNTQVNAGHGWWQLNTGAPVEAINQFAASIFDQYFVNMETGYGPEPPMPEWSPFPIIDLAGPGLCPFPNNDSPTVQRTYGIGFQGPGVMNGLDHTVHLSINGGTWDAEWHNCVEEDTITAGACGISLPVAWLPEEYGFELPPNSP
jgi:hypothetical protein